MKIQTTVECPVYNSFRVSQVAGLFDVPIAEKTRQSFSVELPEMDEDWQIGLIVGPSGSGKSTIARAAFGEALWTAGAWATDRAVIDCFDRPVKEVTQMLTAVGFSSPPSWVKPYSVLSNGEKFRCDLAKALLCELPLVAFDEFSSVIDRVVAKVGSAAVAKAIRGGAIQKRFVAVSCHYDIAEWLEPDWVLDMASGKLARGRLRRPPIQLDIQRCSTAAWPRFAKHHYLSADLHKSARCYMATWAGTPVAFCAMLSSFGHIGCWRISRIVVLPDYQGIGAGTRVMEACADILAGEGKRVSIVASHPAIRAHCQKSPLWRLNRVHKLGGAKHAGRVSGPENRRAAGSTGRSVAAFEYIGNRNAAIPNITP